MHYANQSSYLSIEWTVSNSISGLPSKNAWSNYQPVHIQTFWRYPHGIPVEEYKKLVTNVNWSSKFDYAKCVHHICAILGEISYIQEHIYINIYNVPILQQKEYLLTHDTKVVQGIEMGRGKFHYL